MDFMSLNFHLDLIISTILADTPVFIWNSSIKFLHIQIFNPCATLFNLIFDSLPEYQNDALSFYSNFQSLYNYNPYFIYSKF